MFNIIDLTLITYEILQFKQSQTAEHFTYGFKEAPFAKFHSSNSYTTRVAIVKRK